MKKLCILLFILLLLFLGAVLFLFVKYADNTTLQLTTYQISHKKIPSEFNGFRIAQVSDLHNAEFGEGNADLLALLSESDPDIIVFTGDQLDARKTDQEIVLNLVEKAVQIAPCYLVTGNHEGSIIGMREFHNQLEAAGVVFLDNEVTTLSHNGAYIDLVGLTDATMSKFHTIIDNKVILETTLQALDWDHDRYSILLAHNPGFLYVYERNGIDLALCGHNHGGQIRVNGRGLISAGNELFPQYDSGVFTHKKATMVLSRGLGNSRFPWRINNPPELVIVELICQA